MKSLEERIAEKTPHQKMIDICIKRFEGFVSQLKIGYYGYGDFDDQVAIKEHCNEAIKTIYNLENEIDDLQAKLKEETQRADLLSLELTKAYDKEHARDLKDEQRVKKLDELTKEVEKVLVENEKLKAKGEFVKEQLPRIREVIYAEQYADYTTNEAILLMNNLMEDLIDKIAKD